MIAEEHVEVLVVFLEHVGYMLSSLPAINVWRAESRTLTEPLTDAVNTQELVELGSTLVAVPEGP